MPSRPRPGFARRFVLGLGAGVAAGFALTLVGLVAPAPATAAPRDVVRAVVGLRTEVPDDARTAATLGREREGSGVVIDNSGLVLTIGYLIVEASGIEVHTHDGTVTTAEVVAYDAESGFGLVRTVTPLAVPAAPLGSSADLKVGDPVLVLGHVGRVDGRQAAVADRREFVGYWEYLLEDAIFTSPPFAHYGGAALIDRQGRLVGVGSLFVGDAAGKGITSPGNMFVPIDALKPILGELLADGRRDGPARPWLGVYAQEAQGALTVTRTADDSPAARAGLQAGDIIESVGGQKVTSLGDLYRKIWSQGAAGTIIPLQVRKRGTVTTVEVASIDRRRWLKWQQSF